MIDILTTVLDGCVQTLNFLLPLFAVVKDIKSESSFPKLLQTSSFDIWLFSQHCAFLVGFNFNIG